MKTLNTLIVILALTATASAAPARLVLRLHDTQGHSFTYSTEVDATRYANGATPSPTELAGHLTSAKEQMAHEIGYTAALYGPDHYKMLGAVRVAGAWFDDGRRRDALGWFRGEPERGE